MATSSGLKPEGTQINKVILKKENIIFSGGQTDNTWVNIINISLYDMKE